ncbi:MOSC domain-containing protein [Nocardia camponoti]|uniref:MOSC domain-containing protein n=1 Tax=Nocardia camponoti TaxID=1616106 RepID=A0A917Q8I2_9NOCA|nr:MOSC domain-containing protein [Nocardia camponoti]GGK35013.1 MOSC domain-containing protein [Nocardia camponoti]
MNSTVVSVSSAAKHEFSKQVRSSIRLLAGLGVEGDAHAGVTVRHRSRVAQDPTQPNYRQVHLIATELFDDLAAHGFSLAPGMLGENITTRGIDLLALSAGTRLRIGPDAIVEVTGLRNPCGQIENFRTGLLKQVVGRDDSGELVRRAGVMGIVVAGGVVRAGTAIVATPPIGPFRKLDRI